MADTPPTNSKRFAALLDHLGVETAHLVSSVSGDWGPIVDQVPERLRSLTLVAPYLSQGVPERLSELKAPLLVVAGSEGRPGAIARSVVREEALVALPGYESLIWADIARDRSEAVLSAIERNVEAGERGDCAPQGPEEGEVAGLRFRTSGSGPPLVLTPLALAPSQWEPLLPTLTSRYRVVLASGAGLGIVRSLEDRFAGGYDEMVLGVFHGAAVRPGETMLEVGCGSGALARAMVASTSGHSPLVCADINPYLIEEAAALMDGMRDTIGFVAADAVLLPFGDGAFDVIVASTVLEEVDADAAISAMVAALRPGGRLVAIVRAVDQDWWTSLRLPDAERGRIHAYGKASGAGVAATGCADASLYRRLARHGALSHAGLRFSVYRQGARLGSVLRRLGGGAQNRAAYDDAVAEARSGGWLAVGEPFHCAVLTKSHV